ncbi:glycosyltransferase [Acidithiobacillus thiooxidans]|uniref:glycosyltransferase n=1 Tax=Acidithiobacillus thiooxidans TaxID=930 RepID=UPI001C0754FD|nr:glycosyltransferase [Acidithiobacillus thiooxidans]MBU2836587.1 glycosyltransferase [Acidithiobacillus thiooxidans]
MRIVIDLQGAQTSGSRHRGIGRYSLSLVLALARNRGEHDLHIALNGLFPDTIEPIREAFDGLLPQKNIHIWQAVGPVAGLDVSNDRRRQSAQLVREAFLASLKPDVVHVTSLFEGLGDNSITSVGELSEKIPTTVTLYDLIPYIQPKPYLEDPIVEKWYRGKIEHLLRAHLWLAISGSSRREGLEHLGLPEEWVVNISSDADARFKPLEISPDDVQIIRQKYGLTRPFVMYTGGIDYRKNIEGLIRAYAKLPQQLRRDHQLAIVCSVQPEQKAMLVLLAMEQGLDSGELVLTGFVPEEDLLALYNLCALFVFPSWHEGFGLPVLEAMRCGAPVIGANASSIPEVIGWEEALFDPHSEDEMAAAIQRGLTDENFCDTLIRHSKTHAESFSWDESARRAIEAMERLHLSRKIQKLEAKQNREQQYRPKLAYISPLPSEKSGIADYSAELLPALVDFYEIEVIIDQADVKDHWIKEHCHIRSVNWFEENHHQFDRIMYHFGNSHFHQHMLPLLNSIPGVVVLHDFFLSGIQAYRDVHGAAPHAWAQALYLSHGYHAVKDRYTTVDIADIIWRYPANLPVLQRAQGIIVHGEYSKKLSTQWYDPESASDWNIIPHLRFPAAPSNRDREALRRQLGFTPDDLIICSFGLLGPTKLNHRLLQAFLSSPLSVNPMAQLVFVGENHGDEYGQDLLQTITKCESSARVHITGWTDTETFRAYLAASDIAVQLRAFSRGETSGTVLDCMNYQLPTIVNAHGSLADLDKNGVWMLPDDFVDDDLVAALTTLANDRELRQKLGTRARDIVHTRHVPRACAQMYFEAIERSYDQAKYGLPGLLSATANIYLRDQEVALLASCLADNFPPSPRNQQLFIDISALMISDLKTEIQSIAPSILREWLKNTPKGFRIEPIYAMENSPGYLYARQFTCEFLGMPDDWAQDEPAEAWPGDVFVGLDLQPSLVPAQQTYLQGWHNRGVKVWFMVYDLLPILLPQFFPTEAQIHHQHRLESIIQFDGVACISRAVADEMLEWLTRHGSQRERPLAIEWFHLGADVNASVPTRGLSTDAPNVLDALNARPSFLMVGTVEPRKGHAQTLGAFDLLWKSGIDVNLVIVGGQGWMLEPLVERLRSHSELTKRLFWLEGISDEYLEKVYAESACLIAASYGEGFGLPLIEAAQHKLPIIARDIPVFREVAGEYAFYFNAPTSEDLAQSIRHWLELYAVDQHPKSDAMPWLTWKESAQQLLTVLEITKSQPDISETNL